MAVTIDLGSGKRATLSSDSGLIRTAEQRAAVSELMLHWPKYADLISGAIGYLRELGLAGSFSGDPVAALRSAIEDGRVSVSIDRPVVGGGAGGGGGGPSTPPFPKASRFASVPGVAALPVDKPLPSWAVPSDVSAGELMNYLQSVVAGTGGALAGGTPQLANSFGSGSPLGDANVFDYADSPLSGDIQELAASTTNPNFAAKILGYERKIFGNMHNYGR